VDVENAQTMKKSAGGGVPSGMKKIVAAGAGRKRQSDLTKLLSQQHYLRLRTRPLVDSEGRL
jgi:hypothetical protein